VGLVADVQAYLGTLSPEVIDGSTEWPSVRRRVNDALGHQLVVITEDGGAEPETPSASGIGDSALAEPAVQIRVRGEPWDGDGALAKAQEIYDALNGLLGVTMGSTIYMRVKAQTAEPVFIGFDTRGRPEFTVSFSAVRSVTAP
jgi:hypothetical protein